MIGGTGILIRAGIVRGYCVITVLLLLLAGMFAGCAEMRGGKTRGEPTAATKPAEHEDGPLRSIFGSVPRKTGAQLWADNCTRCHYVRPPDYYSAAQWQLVMQHMRLRANLTGGEERKITEFLKAGSGVE
jgi:hypothetical protein